MVTKLITNTTLKKFVLNWNYYVNDNLVVKTLRIAPQSLNMECKFSDENDFNECKKQNSRYFVNGNLLVGKESEKNAVKKNETNAEANLKTAEEKIDTEIENIKTSAKKASGKNTKVDVQVKEA